MRRKRNVEETSGRFIRYHALPNIYFLTAGKVDNCSEHRTTISKHVGVNCLIIFRFTRREQQ